jgi:hypothetical protein
VFLISISLSLSFADFCAAVSDCTVVSTAEESAESAVAVLLCDCPQPAKDATIESTTKTDIKNIHLLLTLAFIINAS